MKLNEMKVSKRQLVIMWVVGLLICFGLFIDTASWDPAIPGIFAWIIGLGIIGSLISIKAE